jgi:hypothetical protein
VHLYGPRTGEVDGRDYDTFRDYVCDRLEDPADEIPENAAHEWPVHGRLESTDTGKML